MNGTIKNIFSFLARVVLSAVLLWWLFRKIDLAQMGAVLKTADLALIGWALFVFLLINLMLLVRWFVFIRALGLKAAFIDVLRNFFIGLFCNLFLPSAIGGDIVKAFGLSRNSSQKARVVASVLLDRLSGFVGIVLVALGSFVVGSRWIEDKTLLWMIMVLGGCSFLVLTVLLNEKLFKGACRVFDKLPRVRESLMALHYDMALIKGKYKETILAVGLSCLSQIVLAGIFFLIIKGLGRDVPLIYFLVFSPLVCVAASLPSIGGLGVREFGWVYFLGKISVARDVSLSMSLISFLFMVVVGLLGGLIYVITVSSGRLQHCQPNPASQGQKS